MSKVLIDRELLESALKTIHGLAPGRFTVEEELRAAVTAQPAEAEGVDFGFDDRSVKVSQEAYSIFLEREQHHLAALSAVTAERDRLRADRDDCLAAREHYAGRLGEALAEVEALRGFMRRLEKHAEYWSDCTYVEVLEGIVEEWKAADAAMAAKEA